MKKPTPFGKYYLLERINVGGMAEVFRAKAFGVEGFERLVAVKRILPNIAEDKEFIRMFIEEAKLAVQLNHANIAQIFDLGVVDGAYYIALEHVHGRDLRAMFDRCRQIGDPMPVAQACFIIMKLCEGLDYAHNKRDQSGREMHLVHRDVSPQNVLVSFEGEVKVIDFGIAKAANKGNKTQAGILKGKFGYMSPEQVRGIPIDRRSDVFSCGIVLYELLTGERLFVGESDFSTLEKVRNVEILPPSTYNRRIPDELERIVLKALAKDPEDRYQNAIDLHDELQAFVYTAGEFYSRKDLAGWMKKIFGREIEDETAKLENYRQLKAPAEIVSGPVVAARANGSKPPVTAPRRTAAMPAVGNTKPPPPPSRTSSQSLPVTVPTAKVGKVGKGKGDGSGELEWDDDELETQIYDDENTGEKQPKGGAKPVGLPLAAAPEPAAPPPMPAKPASTIPPPIPAAAMAASAPPSVPPPSMLDVSPTTTLKGNPPGPDLSSLVSTTKGWEAVGGPPAATPSNGTTKPPPFANGSGKGPAPAAPVDDPIAAALAMPMPIARETSASARMVAHESVFERPSTTFGSGVLARKTGSHKSRNSIYVAVGGAALAVVAVVVVIAMTGGKSSTKAPAPAGTQSTAATPVAASDQNTGFDLYVFPAGVTTWRLDGETRTDKLPSRIRGITAGAHQVAIDAPPGFMSQNQSVNVDLGKAQKIEIQLQPIAGIHGEFESSPPGATVSLFVDGKREVLGPSPAKSPLDPRKAYHVLFEKPGYVSVNQPLAFTGALEEKVTVNLEKAGNVAVADNSTTPTPPPVVPKTTPPPPVAAITTTPKTTPAPPPVTHEHEHVATTEPKPSGGTGASGGGFDDVVQKPSGEGTLLLGSKPPCDILVDGSSTGLHTPQRDMKLSAGKHKITLVNDDLGIKETFTVSISAGQTEKQIKDFSDKIKQP